MHSTQDLVQACDTRPVTEARKVKLFRSHLSMSGYLFLNGVFGDLVHLRVATGVQMKMRKNQFQKVKMEKSRALGTTMRERKELAKKNQ